MHGDSAVGVEEEELVLAQIDARAEFVTLANPTQTCDPGKPYPNL